MLRHHWPNLGSVFLEFGCIGDDVLSNQVSWRLAAPSSVHMALNPSKRLCSRQCETADDWVGAKGGHRMVRHNAAT